MKSHRKGLAFNFNLVIGLAIAFLVWWLVSKWIGPGFGFLATALGTIGFLALAKWLFSGFIPWVNNVPIIKGLNKRTAMWTAIISLVVFFGMTAVGPVGQLISGINPFHTASVVAPATVQSVAPATGTLSCKDSVPAELLGKPATITVNAYDMESNTPYSAAVDVNPTSLLVNGQVVSTLTDTSAYSISSGVVVGDVISFRGGSSTYYLDPTFKVNGKEYKTYCVGSQEVNVELSAHAVTSESNLQMTGYDSTGATELSSGTADQEDYYITASANEQGTFYLKLKNNIANKAYNFDAWAIAKFYNISSIKPHSGYVKVVTPKSLEGINILVNETTGNTLSIYKDYAVYARSDGPLMLHEFDSVKVQFDYETDPSNDPIATTHNQYFNGVAILSKDAAWARGADGQYYLDFYQHDTSGGDVGLAETATSPLGKQDGVLIEFR